VSLKFPVHEFVKAVKSHLPFVPNEQQQSLIEQLGDFIQDENENALFVLKGYAGTGKTNLISAFINALPAYKWKSVLLAPTGRAAKVLSNTSGKPAQTIHKKIFSNDIREEGRFVFSLGDNQHTNTIFIVDEASMISVNAESSLYEKNLLESLLEYVYSGFNCKLIFVGDTAQLPPVGSDYSPALNHTFLKQNYHLALYVNELTQVARQKSDSGILYNATKLRISLLEPQFVLPKLETTHDVVHLGGEDLEDALNQAFREYGAENVIIITRSNKRANLFNQNVRNRIYLYEEDLCSGDRLMVVKNNYYWKDKSDKSFIANGDMGQIKRISKREELYGFHFAECILKFTDYENEPELQVKVITDSLFSDSPALSSQQQQQLFEELMLDCADEPDKWKKMAYLRSSPYFNALQIKFAYAVTCHKSQGGQWPCVFIDHGFLNDEQMNAGFIRWLYTALTRATEKVYLINFSPSLMFN
jgi:exodeoxyribonuclease V